MRKNGNKTESPPGAVVRRMPPKRSSVYREFWRFAAERQRIYLRRLSGQCPPWTSDGVLQDYKFTNAYRASDRVSQHLIRLMYQDERASCQDVFLRTILFKIFNKIETWSALVARAGQPTERDYRAGDYELILSELKQKGRSIYSGAYIMPSGGRVGSKHAMHLRLVERMMGEDLPQRLSQSKSLEEAYHLFLDLPSLGPFLAFQYAIDFNYSRFMNHSEMEFVVAGPGAIDGLSKCFTSLGEYSPADAVKALCESQDEEFERHATDFDGLWSRPLQLIDVQNLLCEISKYTRVTHPHVAGVSGRKRIKQRFSPTGPIPRPFFPPKWCINQNVEKWFAETERSSAGRAEVSGCFRDG